MFPLSSSRPFKFERWPTEYRKITQHFGANPLNYAQFGLPGHEGVDIRAPSGSKIFSVAPGEVYKLQKRAQGHNYGIHVRVKHRDGYMTVYAHLQRILVEVGQRVSTGTVLGLADNTGNSFGSHLHLTLKKEDAHYRNYPHNIIDPTPYLLPLLGWQAPSGPYEEGWILASGVVIHNELAQVNPGGINLRIAAGKQLLVPGGTIIIVAGPSDKSYIPVKVPKAALGEDDATVPFAPAPQPPPSLATVDGWAWGEKLHTFDNQAVIVARHGVNLRAQANSGSQNIGIVRAGSTVTRLGEAEAGYHPVRVRRADFIGPIQLSNNLPLTLTESLADLPHGVLLGWTQTHYLQVDGRHASTRHRGVALRNQPDVKSELIGMVKGDAPIIIAGAIQGSFSPILVADDMMFSIVNPRLNVSLPEAFPPGGPPTMPPSQPIQDTTAGWVLTHNISLNGDSLAHTAFDVYLRNSPRRDAGIIGLVPATRPVMVMGLPYGEFTPVRVEERALQSVSNAADDPDDSDVVGQARIGLHASADPDIKEAEFQEFTQLRPGIIKALSFHNEADIRRLAGDHPGATWVLRAFLDFGRRRISPAQFVRDTQPDVSRSLKVLAGRNVVIELHNEPNLIQEGLGNSWKNGGEFSDWWLEVLKKYRRAFPDSRFIYPGLSPGGSIIGSKVDHIQFVEASREAVEAADGLGVHLYWSHIYPMRRALDVLDDYISRFRYKPIWVTEASNNKAGTPVAQKANQYLQFWNALQQRPIVQGVTYFIASASNPEFAEEVWVGRGIGKIVGAR